MAGSPGDSERLAAAVGEAMWARDRASQALGMTLEEVRPGAARLRMRVRGDMLNGHGTCHGGVVFALADSAFAFACNSHGSVAVASGCTIEFLVPAREGDELVAEAAERAREGRHGVYDVEVRRADGGLVAVFRGRSTALRRRHLPERLRLRTGVPVSGVDGYRGGWVALEVGAGGSASVRTAGRLAELLGGDTRVVAVDVPIGIPERKPRPADREARRLLGGRASSVFETPPRAVLDAATYAEARRAAVELTGKSVSAQAYALRARILEADALARADDRLVEVHPELSFLELAAGAPLASKHTPEGLAERRALLESAGLVLPERPAGVPEADLLDAAAAAWSGARYAHGEAEPLPAGAADRIGAIWR